MSVTSSQDDPSGESTPSLTHGDLLRHRAEIERMLIERETRIVPIWMNVLNTYRSEGWRGLSFQAALKALLWKFLSPSTAATAAVGIAGIVTLMLTWQTNRLMERQNSLIEVQNLLQESSRRAGLTVELTEVLNRIGEKDWMPYKGRLPLVGSRCKQEKYDYRFQLSPGFAVPALGLSTAMVGRVVALSNSFKPYRYLDVTKNDLTSDLASGLSEPSSPERAQLLISLASANISLEQVSKAGGNFEKSPLGNAQLTGQKMTDIFADGSDFNGAILVHSDFSGAHLRWSYFTEANATCAVFDGADLREADMADGQFMGASFRGANLSGARVFITKFNDADFSGADLRGVYTCSDGQPVDLDSKEAFLAEVGQVTVDQATQFGPPEGSGANRHCN